MNTNENPHPYANLINTGQDWIKEAVAQQEEHLRRIRSCTGGPDKPEPVVGLAHDWNRFSPEPGCETYEACWRCRVTRTNDDWLRKTTPRPRV